MRDGELDDSSRVLTSNTQVFKGTYPSHFRPLFVHFKQEALSRHILLDESYRSHNLCAPLACVHEYA